jgi:hypothetical protein
MKYFKIFGGQTESYKFPVAVTAMNIQGVEFIDDFSDPTTLSKTMLRLIEPGVVLMEV